MSIITDILSSLLLPTATCGVTSLPLGSPLSGRSPAVPYVLTSSVLTSSVLTCPTAGICPYNLSSSYESDERPVAGTAAGGATLAGRKRRDGTRHETPDAHPEWILIVHSPPDPAFNAPDPSCVASREPFRIPDHAYQDS
ncbi:hypothetical protein ACLOJK_006880 [Asimina triloba]